jgi:hypothetical protein
METHCCLFPHFRSDRVLIGAEPEWSLWCPHTGEGGVPNSCMSLPLRFFLLQNLKARTLSHSASSSLAPACIPGTSAAAAAPLLPWRSWVGELLMLQYNRGVFIVFLRLARNAFGTMSGHVCATTLQSVSSHAALMGSTCCCALYTHQDQDLRFTFNSTT